MNITNNEFLKAIVSPARRSGLSKEEGRLWVCGRSKFSQNWSGTVYSREAGTEEVSNDNYFCISLLKSVDGNRARQKKNFCALMCIVLDDVGTKSKKPNLEPSWKLETSPNNEQWGYVLSEPIMDLAEAESLFTSLADAGYTDPGAKAPSTRYMRLPVGVNSKDEHLKGNNGKPFPVVLKSWDPTKLFTVEDLRDKLNLEPPSNQDSKTTSTDLCISKESNADLMRLVLEGEVYHDALLRLAASHISKGSSVQGTIQTLRDLMLANQQTKNERWKARFNDIPRIVKTANEKFSKAVSSTNFTLHSAIEFLAISPPSWVVKNLLPKSGVSMIFGKSGAGKSFFTLDLMLAIAQGKEWCGLKTKKSKVVYVVAEGVSGFRNRMAAYAMVNELDMASVPILIVPQAPNLRVDDDIALIRAIEEQGDADIVVVDTLAQASAGANENSAEDMGAVLKRCQNIQESIGGLVVLVHHTGKDESRGARGWSGLKAAMDTEIEVSASSGGGVKSMEARVTKQKDGEDGKVYAFCLRQVVLGQDEDGEDITSCVVEYDNYYRRKPKPTGKWQERALTSASAISEELLEPFSKKALLEHMLKNEPRQDSGVDIGKRDSRRDSAMRGIERMIDKGWFSADGEKLSLVRNASLDKFCVKAT